ncbi:MAG: HD domain-containing protein [Candidatus Omnitrophica bacterium]|nr:HD domain-containing protein [Candidatus Omnitrophota bacterium]
MPENIQHAFKELIFCLQTSRLYPSWHPEFKKSVERAYVALSEALKNKTELVIGIVGGELAFEKEIFFDLSQRVKPMIEQLKEKGIERISIYSGLTLEELNSFIAIINSKDDSSLLSREAMISAGIKNISVGKIKTTLASSLSEKAANAVNFLGLYDESLDKVTGSLENVLNAQTLDHLTLQVTMKTVMDNLLGRHQDFLNITAVKRYDLSTFAHLFNTAILSMYFSTRMGFNQEAVREVGVAALFHDIGKLYISRKIIRKPDGLTVDEFDKIKNHVILGAELLLKYVDGLGELPLVVCFEHHLKYDLSGYPKISFYKKPHIASLIVTICDVYDALSSRRSYKSDYPPLLIYEIMNKDRGRAFHPGLLDKFFQTIGVWPQGTFVGLSDSRIAVVVEENEDDIFFPKVRIVSGEGQGTVIDLKESKATLKIERYLNPLTEGKEFLGKV